MAYKDKAKEKAHRAQYYIENREKALAYQAESRAANREAYREKDRTYYATHRDKLLADKATYWTANRDKLLAYKAAYRTANRDKVLTRQAAYNATVEGEKRQREHHWRRQGIVGITLERYNTLTEEHGHICAICKDGNVRSGKDRALEVDHCHSTGLVRGLLCSACNRNVGRLEQRGFDGTHRCKSEFESKVFSYLLQAEINRTVPKFIY